MKLDKLHVRDHRAGAPPDSHAISGSYVRIGGVQINFAATAGSQHDPVRADCLDLAALLVEHVNPKTTVFRGEAKFAGGDQIHRHVVFQQFDLRLPIQLAQQRVLDLLASHIPNVQNAAL